MCISSITSMGIAKEDMKVFKCFEFFSGDLVPPYYSPNGVLNYPAPVNLSHYARPTSSGYYIDKQHIKGYHCFTNYDDAVKYGGHLINLVIVQFIIPKGTKVIYGRDEFDFTVLVSEVLTNPVQLPDFLYPIVDCYYIPRYTSYSY